MSESKTIKYTPMQILIRLVSAGARKECITDLQVDWQAVLPLAVEQNVLSLVACALLHSPELKCPAELREAFLNAMRNEASVNLIRRQRITKLLHGMKQAGIEAKVLKGYALSGCYAYPECRGSVDTDLLIDVNHEKQAIEFFEAQGFRIDPRAATSHHTICQHKKYGMVEVHVSLYEELVQDIWLQDFSQDELVREEPISVEDAGGDIHTLGCNDMLIFLSLHMAKHFILSGLTLKMMLDSALYYARNKDAIDVERYWSTLEKLHYDKLVNGILWNMIHAGGFFVEDFPGLQGKNPAQMQLILRDLEQGGYMGAKESAERFESGMEYNRQLMRKKQNAEQYCLRMLGLKIKSGAKYMFPSAKVLRNLYPITKNVPVLMPLLWVWQVFSFPVKKVRSGSLRRNVRLENTPVTKTAEGRLTMFKELEML